MNTTNLQQDLNNQNDQQNDQLYDPTNFSMEEQAQQHKNEGNLYFKKKNFNKAIEHYSKAIELNPNNAIFYSNRCACYQQLNDFKNMILDAKKTIILDPNFTKGYTRLAKAYMELNKFNKAFYLYKKLLNLQTENSENNLQNTNLNEEEKKLIENDFQKCKNLLEKEYLNFEKLQTNVFINPIANIGDLISNKRIEMEVRREYYLNYLLNYFTMNNLNNNLNLENKKLDELNKNLKNKIIDLLDPILKPMKQIAREFSENTKNNENATHNVEGNKIENKIENKMQEKVFVTLEEQKKLENEINSRYLPDNRFNYNKQVELIKINYLNGLQNTLQNNKEWKDINILQIVIVVLFYFARPEVAYRLLKDLYFKNNNTFVNNFVNDNTIVNDQNLEKIHAYTLLIQSLLFWKGPISKTINLTANNKLLTYFRKTLQIITTNTNLEIDPNLKQTLISLYLTILQTSCPPNEESNLTKIEIENILQDINQLQFLLNNESNFNESLQYNTLSQEGYRFWLILMQMTPGASDQFQKIIILPENEVIPLIGKIFNEFNSEILPLPKVCLNNYFLNSLSSFMKLNLESFIKKIRIGLLNVTKIYFENLNNNNLNNNFKNNFKNGFLQKELIPLFMSIALQCYHTRYCYLISENEEILLQKCIDRAIYILNNLNAKISLLDENVVELRHLFIVISMYEPLSERVLQNEQFCNKIALSHKDYNIYLSKLLNYTVKIPLKINHLLNNTNLNNNNNLLNKFENAFTMPIDELNFTKIKNQINCKIYKEIEWTYPNEFWPKGFEKSIFNILLISSSYSESNEIKRYLHKYSQQELNILNLELNSEKLNLISKERFKSIENQVCCKFIENLNDLVNSDSLLLQKKFDMISLKIDNFIYSDTNLLILNKLLNNNEIVREGAIIKLTFPSIHQLQFIKEIRNYLAKHEYFNKNTNTNNTINNIFEVDEFNNVKLTRIPTRKDILLAREIISKKHDFAEQLSRMADFYNTNAFCEFLFNPSFDLITANAINNNNNNKVSEYANGFTFEKMATFCEKVLGLRIISLMFNAMPLQVILDQYIEETKDVKCKQWKSIDQFANKHVNFFQAPIFVICEKPVKEVVVDKKKDPLGLKKYLHKFTSK